MLGLFTGWSGGPSRAAFPRLTPPGNETFIAIRQERWARKLLFAPGVGSVVVSSRCKFQQV